MATAGTSGGLVTTSSGTASTRGAEVRVDIKNLAFNPASITVRAGDTVTWTNSDSMAHTVTADNGEFDSGNLAQEKALAPSSREKASIPKRGD